MWNHPVFTLLFASNPDRLSALQRSKIGRFLAPRSLWFALHQIIDKKDLHLSPVLGNHASENTV
jgi:hypothetical protein